MTVLDSLAPCPPGRWTHDHVTVEHVPSGDLTLHRGDDRLHVTHSLTADQLSERLVAEVTASVQDAAFGQDEFELTMVGLVRSTIPGASMRGSPTTAIRWANYSTAQPISPRSTTRPKNSSGATCSTSGRASVSSRSALPAPVRA